MTDAFLSHARDDRRYFPLVIRLLEFHRVDVWYDSGEIPAGTAYREEIESALASASRLLVMVTRSAARSRWVSREVGHFRAVKPVAPVVPLLFDDVVADEIFDGLSDFQSISFVDDLDTGFSKLLALFGKPFLPVAEQRIQGERRQRERRTGDRRRASNDTRLRIGMWKNFSSATGSGEYDDFGEAVIPSPTLFHPTEGTSSAPTAAELPSPRTEDQDSTVPTSRVSAVNRLARVLAAENSELQRYTFRDRRTGEVIDLDFETVRTLVHATCREMETFGSLKNVYVVERLAENLCRLYDVCPSDRRTGERRSSGDRRRSEPRR